MIKITFDHPHNQSHLNHLTSQNILNSLPHLKNAHPVINHSEINPNTNTPIIILQSCMEHHPFAIYTHLMQSIHSKLNLNDIFCIQISVDTPDSKMVSSSELETLIYGAMDCGFSLLKKETASDEAVLLYFLKSTPKEYELTLE